MSKRYTYSRTIHTREGDETFTADQFDSFDEAIRIVDRGINDRKLFLKEKYPDLPIGGFSPNPVTPGPAPMPDKQMPPLVVPPGAQPGTGNPLPPGTVTGTLNNPRFNPQP